MAELIFEGIDELILSMEQVANMPEEVLDEMLVEQAEFLVPQLKLRAAGFLGYESEMARSIKRGKPKKGKKGGRQLVISPRGKRIRGKEKKQVISNSEIAFLVNYGRRGQMALPFWTDTEKLSAKTLDKICLMVYDRWLKKLGL